MFYLQRIGNHLLIFSFMTKKKFSMFRMSDFDITYNLFASNDQRVNHGKKKLIEIFESKKS